MRDRLPSLSEWLALHLTQPCCHGTPTSGQLKQLSILKVDQNRLCEVTEAIGDCENLSELILTENLLTVGPASQAPFLKVSVSESAWEAEIRGTLRRAEQGWVPLCGGSQAFA